MSTNLRAKIREKMLAEAAKMEKHQREMEFYKKLLEMAEKGQKRLTEEVAEDES